VQDDQHQRDLEQIVIDGKDPRLTEQVAISFAKLSVDTKAASRLSAAIRLIPCTPKTA